MRVLPVIQRGCVHTKPRKQIGSQTGGANVSEPSKLIPRSGSPGN